jgi:hypothetical protein
MLQHQRAALSRASHIAQQAHACIHHLKSVRSFCSVRSTRAPLRVRIDDLRVITKGVQHLHQSLNRLRPLQILAHMRGLEDQDLVVCLCVCACVCVCVCS